MSVVSREGVLYAAEDDWDKPSLSRTTISRPSTLKAKVEVVIGLDVAPHAEVKFRDTIDG